VVLQVLGEEHRGHTATADVPLDGITVGKCRLETFQEVRHIVLRWNEESKINIRERSLERPLSPG
jgi:hypothetical protein